MTYTLTGTVISIEDVHNSNAKDDAGIIFDTFNTTDILGYGVTFIFNIDFEKEGSQILYSGDEILRGTDTFYAELMSGGLISTVGDGVHTGSGNAEQNLFGEIDELCLFGTCLFSNYLITGDSADDVTYLKTPTSNSAPWVEGTQFIGEERAHDTDTGKRSVIHYDLKLASISAVPVPAAFWLFGTALIGFIGFSRRTLVT